MTDHQDHDTEAAPTEQASPPTTELPPANHAAAESVHAWSLDDTADVDSAPPRSRFVWAGLVTLVVVIAGALIYLAATLFGSRAPKPVEPKAQPTTTVPVAPPPPPAVTGRAAPPPPTSLTPEERDARFVALVAPKLPPKYNDGKQPEVAHRMCADIGQGESLAYVVSTYKPDDVTWDAMDFLATTAVQMYCPQYANR